MAVMSAYPKASVKTELGNILKDVEYLTLNAPQMFTTITETKKVKNNTLHVKIK